MQSNQKGYILIECLIGIILLTTVGISLIQTLPKLLSFEQQLHVEQTIYNKLFELKDQTLFMIVVLNSPSPFMSLFIIKSLKKIINYVRRTKGGIPLFKHFAFSLSNHGFLLVEHLIAICVISILMITLTQFIPMIDNFQTDLDQATSQELTALSTQLQKEAKSATHFSTNQSTLQVHLANGTVTSYNVSNHRLMRQVDEKGGEVALYHCEKIDILLHQPQCVTLKLYTSKDETYDIYLSSSLFPLEGEALDEQ